MSLVKASNVIKAGKVAQASKPGPVRGGLRSSLSKIFKAAGRKSRQGMKFKGFAERGQKGRF